MLHLAVRMGDRNSLHIVDFLAQNRSEGQRHYCVEVKRLLDELSDTNVTESESFTNKTTEKNFKEQKLKQI